MTILQPFIDVFNSMKEGVMTVFEGLKQFFTAAWTIIKNIFLGALLLLIDLVTGDFESLKANAIAIWENIKGALRQAWEAIKNIFRGALVAVRNGVSTAWQKLKEIIRTGMESARTTIRNIWDKVMSFFRNIDLKQIGKDIIQGLIDGIVSLKDTVLRKAREIADGIKNRIKGALGIASPSKVMMGLGADTAEGFALGIESMLGDIRRVSGQMAQTAISTSEDVVVTGPSATASPGVVDRPLINIENMVIREEADIQKVATEFWRLLQRQSRF
ncbi:hypothetical protein CHM34_18260 [Paludifilum halophilum]|uniref:Phage tail tape measure protein n=1 Tax=Paludifilum halophilum TaxID=1642702 RepID=A0A235B1B6_9BACL|nr:hypothetical protein CHM34_18260 [Paludifilum halophilum]